LPATTEADEAVWGTFGCDRTVLAIARTLTSAVRLLETLDLFRGDFRVRVVFTVNDTTRFATGVEALLRTAGVHDIVPWSRIPDLHYDLAVSASENIDFDAVTGPVVVLPHGIGFNKYVPGNGGTGLRLAGLPPEDALRTGRVRVVLSHPDQDAQLRAACPHVAGHTVVTGDATCDRLLASGSLRARYRELLGTGDRRLVMISSTWGRESLIGRERTLPRRLLAELPADDYQVALALHPNVWARYGAAQIRVWLADALDAGLLLCPPHHSWHAVLVAANQVIADHGSMGLHAAALDKPLLLTAADSETVPGTPIAELAAAADRLDPDADLRDQLDRNFATHTSGRFEPIARRVFAHRGEAIQRLRAELYDQLRLAPPGGEPGLPRVPDPAPERRQVTAFRVAGESGDGEVRLTRYPAAARPAPEDRHLVVEEAETNLRLAERAAVLARSRVTGDAKAWEWTEDALRASPGARLAVAATAGGAVLLLRGGGRFVLTADADATILGSAAYVLFLAGRLRPGTAGVRTTGDAVPVTITNP